MNLSINQVFRRPYPVSLGWQRDLLTIIFVDFSAATLILLLKPFGLSHISQMDPNIFVIVVALCCLVMAVFNKFGLPRIFLSLFSEDTWTTGKEILYSLWNLATVTLIILLVSRLYGIVSFSLTTLIEYCFYTVMIGIVPIIVKTLLTQIWLLKQQIRQIQRIDYKQASHKHDSKIISLKPDGKDPSLQIELDELLFLQAQQNYVQVVSLNHEKIGYHLLRASLKRLESEIDADNLIRCHRSHIVNIAHVKNISGNAQGYQLKLHGELENIPVSRTYSKNILNRLRKVGLDT